MRAYLKQQYEYGKAEGSLERKWPGRFDAGGRVQWAGRVYGPGLPAWLDWAKRIYHGVWNSAPFQSVYRLYPNAALVDGDATRVVRRGRRAGGRRPLRLPLAPPVLVVRRRLA